MKKEIEELVRSLSLPQLQVLKLLTESDKGVFSNQEMITTLSTASYQLGAILTPLRRHKVNGEPLIINAGKDSVRGNRWQINTKLVGRNELKELLIEMEV